MSDHQQRAKMAEHDQYVTRGEFTAFAKEVTGELKTIVDKLDTKTRPNWTAVGVGIGVVIALCGAMFYYFNTRFALAEQAAREYNVQMNVRVERVENKQDEDDRDYKTRYRDIMEKQSP